MVGIIDAACERCGTAIRYFPGSKRRCLGCLGAD